jgi:DNA polymerase
VTRLSNITTVAGLDFETYWDQDYTLDKLSTADYIRDPRFETIGVSVVHAGRRFWLEDHQFREFARRVDWSRVGVAAHHAHFDGGILAFHYGIIPGLYFDTLSMSRAVYGPYEKHDLDALARRAGVGRKLDIPPLVKGLRRADMPQALWEEYGVYSLNDAEVMMEALKVMCAGFPRSELALIDATIRMFTQPGFVLDDALLKQVEIDELERRRDLLAQAGVTEKDLGSAPKFVALLEAMGVEVEMKRGKNGPIPAVAKSDPFMQGLLDGDDEDLRVLAEARLAVKSTLNVTRARRLLTLSRGGEPVPVYIAYYRAHTGRWGGSDGVNWQNPERTSKKDARKGRIRKAIMAPPGYKIVVRDSAQGEARTLAWFARQEDLVTAFAQGRDVYSERASMYYGRTINRKLNPEDEIPGLIGKNTTLGGGYGMGFVKFAMELLRGMFGGPRIQFTEDDIVRLNVDAQAFLNNKWKMKRVSEAPTRLDRKAMLVHCIVCDHIITQYRAANDKIVGLWEYLDEIVIPSMADGAEFDIGPGTPGSVRVSKNSIILPNGLALRYDNLRRSGAQWIYDTPRGIRHLYGGKTTENLIQALHRIIVADQMLQIAERWDVKLMSHDEVAALVRAELAERALVEMGQIMKASPWWGPGLPLASDGGIAVRYGDAK